jgi:hypothetical protein
MPFWRKGSSRGLCWQGLMFAGLSVIFLIEGSSEAQTPEAKPIAKQAATHRANEMTLAGLRPGKDTVDRASILYRKYGDPAETDSQRSWTDACRGEILTTDLDKDKKIQVIRVTWGSKPKTACTVQGPAPWKSGLGLRISDSSTKVVQLYGEPDSKSPSTRDGQPLELWYYAFDWAGQNVPQVMEVLCTRETGGHPGQVVEITLAAPSL